MRVSVRFVDGEQLDGEAERVSLDRGGFTLSGPGGNTRSVWVGSGAIKYIVIKPPRVGKADGDADPREGLELSKVVLHFLDGEILHSYEDEVFAEEPGGFVLRLWDAERRQLVKALVSGSSLKGVFFVDEWDSRTDDEKRSRVSPDEATMQWIDHAVAAAEAAATAEDSPAEPAPEVAERAALHGPMLVEEPSLIDAPVAADPEAAVVAIIVGDTEERRPGFRSALIPRRLVNTAVPGPEELRYRLLRARISEVLGQAGPTEHEDDVDPEKVG